jgi:hypothetical protein
VTDHTLTRVESLSLSLPQREAHSFFTATKRKKTQALDALSPLLLVPPPLYHPDVTARRRPDSDTREKDSYHVMCLLSQVETGLLLLF